MNMCSRALPPSTGLQSTDSSSLKHMQMSLVLELCLKPFGNLVNSTEEARAPKGVYLTHNISAMRTARSCVCATLFTCFSVLDNSSLQSGWQDELECACECEREHISYCFKPVKNIRAVFLNSGQCITNKTEVSHGIKQTIRCLLELCHTLYR